MRSQRTSRARAAAVAVLALAAFAAPVAAQQDWPTKPIRFYVGFPPGGSTDIITRVLGQKLQERLGQPVIVEQKVGGTGVIANDAVAKAPPDGYTMVLLTGGHPGTAAVMRKLPYDPVNDFGMVSTVIAYPMVMSVATQSPIQSLPDLIARAKAKPGTLSFSTAGPGSLHHLFGEWMNIEAGIDMIQVPFKGAAPAMTEVLAGRVDVIIETATFSFGQIRAGKLRPLALSSPARYPLMPDVPVLAETLPGVELMSWLGVAVAPGTPRGVVDKLNGELRQVLAMPDIGQRFADLGGVPLPSSPEEMRARIEREIARWNRVVRIKNIERQ